MQVATPPQNLPNSATRARHDAAAPSARRCFLIVLSVALAGLLLLAGLGLTGCVFAGYDSGTTKTTKPDGTVVEEKHRRANYTDWTQAAQGLASFAGEVDWGAILKGPVGAVLGTASVGGLGLGGLFLRYFASHNQSKGRNQMRIAQSATAKPSP